ncbi:hypothetical protein UFOVP361_98 [uncultured Caudovirales phage]|uniref:Uncharacterized protein n=1 Tax=uncultured Caudovirales phage TaxID=2100421 RepID=A0A6J7WZK8_9CAUD|nr:hypothetical protein UFOVP361_98 [uncultured Caudovirales phage]
MNRELLAELGEDVLLMDGFDDAIIGYSQRINDPILAVYSWDLMVKILMERDGMSDEEAMEYIDFNCLGAWVGEQTPIIVLPL